MRGLSIPVGAEHIAQVGTISANGDAFVGEVIAQVIRRLGRDALITVA